MTTNPSTEACSRIFSQGTAHTVTMRDGVACCPSCKQPISAHWTRRIPTKKAEPKFVCLCAPPHATYEEHQLAKVKKAEDVEQLAQKLDDLGLPAGGKLARKIAAKETAQADDISDVSPLATDEDKLRYKLTVKKAQECYRCGCTPCKCGDDEDTISNPKVENDDAADSLIAWMEEGMMKMYRSMVDTPSDSLTQFMYSHVPEPFYSKRVAAQKKLREVLPNAEAHLIDELKALFNDYRDKYPDATWHDAYGLLIGYAARDDAPKLATPPDAKVDDGYSVQEYGSIEPAKRSLSDAIDDAILEHPDGLDELVEELVKQFGFSNDFQAKESYDRQQFVRGLRHSQSEYAIKRFQEVKQTAHIFKAVDGQPAFSFVPTVAIDQAISDERGKLG